MSIKENIMVVETKILRGEFELSRGLNMVGDEIFNFILSNHRFMPRESAERDPDYKQIIPYITIRHGSLWLLFQRKSAQTETRLHNKYSLGLGGHITREAGEGQYDPIMAGLYRELGEEIVIDHGEPRYIGVLNDDETDVGRVHLGLYFQVSADSTNFELPEADKMSAQWVDAGYLDGYRAMMETWSQFILAKPY